MKKRVVLLLCILTLGLGTLAFADEGMWLFNHFPVDKVKAKYGFAPDQAWLDHVRLSSRPRPQRLVVFRVGRRLIFTNHHIAQGCVHDLSTNGKDYMKNGFYAPTRAEEPKCPGVEFVVLEGIEDVTDKVNAAAKPGMSTADAGKAQREEMSNLENECSTNGMRCDVVTLYSGAMYSLYKYKKYDDIRLVFAPEFDIAFFGGDPDNFEYPRYDLDISFFRAYENDQPAKINDYLKWSPTGVKEGDLVFVSGHPGRTGAPAHHGPARVPARRAVSLAAQVAGPPGRHAAEVQRGVGRERPRSRKRPVRSAEQLQGDTPATRAACSTRT